MVFDLKHFFTKLMMRSAFYVGAQFADEFGKNIFSQTQNFLLPYYSTLCPSSNVFRGFSDGSIMYHSPPVYNDRGVDFSFFRNFMANVIFP